MARFDILDNVRIASPCPMKWEDMYGDERRRFCDQCERHVYDVSIMTADEARLFLLEHEGRVCVTFFRRADGRLITKDCEVGIRIQKSRRARTVTQVGLFGALLMLGLSAWEVLVAMADREMPVPARSHRSIGRLVKRSASVREPEQARRRRLMTTVVPPSDGSWMGQPVRDDSEPKHELEAILRGDNNEYSH